MKKPTKLLMALIIGLGSLSLASVTYADGGGSGDSCKTGNGNNCNNGGGNNGNNGKDGEGEGEGGSSSSSTCTGTVVSACGVQIVKSVCSTTTQAHEEDDHENEEHQHAESDDREHDDYDGHGHNDADNDRDSPENHPGQDFSFDYHYDSNGNMQVGASSDPSEPTIHVNNSEREGTSPDGKITICHRMGGAEVTLDIPDDQINGVKAHGHGDHDMDTIGRCEDEDDNDPSHDTVPRQKLSQSPVVSTSVQACLSAPAGTPITVTLPTGQTWSGNAPGCNASGVSCSVPVGGTPTGGTLPNNGQPNRGGVRTLR